MTWDGEGTDPWLPARLAAMAEVVQTEGDIRRVFWAELAGWLVETARADFQQDAGEEAAIERLLCQTLQLPADEVHELVAAASARVDEAVSLYEFTRVINDHFSIGEKEALIGAMWRVAYADGNLDKYEEHLIRQVAELIYVPHQQYIRLKLEAAG